MQTVIFSFIAIAIVVLIMSVGVIMGRKPIAGSCGGLAAVGIDGKCSICGAEPESCKSSEEGEELSTVNRTDLAYDATAETAGKKKAP